MHSVQIITANFMISVRYVDTNHRIKVLVRRVGIFTNLNSFFAKTFEAVQFGAGNRETATTTLQFRNVRLNPVEAGVMDHEIILFFCLYVRHILQLILLHAFCSLKS